MQQSLSNRIAGWTAPVEGLVAIASTGVPQALSADTTRSFTKLWLYPASGANANGTLAANGATVYVSKSGGARLTAVAVAGGGSGYAVGQVLQVAGGTCVAPAAVLVAAVNGSGAVTAAQVAQPGNYSANPTTTANAATVAAANSGGNGATFNLTMSTPYFPDSLLVNGAPVKYEFEQPVPLSQLLVLGNAGDGVFYSAT
jgi:hypothetical protein